MNAKQCIAQEYAKFYFDEFPAEPLDGEWLGIAWADVEPLAVFRDYDEFAEAVESWLVE